MTLKSINLSEIFQNREKLNDNFTEHISDEFLINNNIVSDKTFITNAFSNYFLNVGITLSRNIVSTGDPLAYVVLIFNQSMEPLSDHRFNRCFDMYVIQL